MDIENGNIVINIIEVNMNWFTIQSQPNLYKLWGRIENDMDVGAFRLVVYNSN